MPAPQRQASIHQVSAQQMVGPNCHNMNFTDVFVYLGHMSRVLDMSSTGQRADMTDHEASNMVLLSYDDLHAVW